MDAMQTHATRPYLVRAIHEWCSDSGLTPYIVVWADATAQVPREYVKDGQIVLNVSYDATSGLRMGSDYLEFRARFAGVSHDVIVPISRVMAIFARENNVGLAFPMDDLPDIEPADAAGSRPAPLLTPVPSSAPKGESSLGQGAATEQGSAGISTSPVGKSKSRPTLKIVK